MPRLSHADQRLVLDALRDLYGETDLGRLRERMVRLAARLVACELGSYNELFTRDARMDFALRIPDSALIRSHFPAFLAYLNEHPLVPHIGRTDGIAIKFSDFLTGRQLRRLNIYNEYFERIGVRHQILSNFDPGRRVQRAISLNRAGRDFSERDRDVLTLLGPHLTQAYWNVSALGRLRRATAAMEATHASQAQAILLVDREQRVQWISVQARDWLRDFLAAAVNVDSLLPDALARWLTQQRRQRTEIDRALAKPPVAVRFSKPQGQLVARYAAEDAEGVASLLLTFERSAEPVALRMPVLTTRENEVLGWIAHGKGNPEIAVILGLKLRTVYKHVENIFAKLDVDNRATAMLVALDAAKHAPQ